MTDLCVAHVPLFEGLSRTEQEGLAQFATSVRFAAGDVISDEHGASALLVVHSGTVEVSRIDGDGGEHALSVLGEGQFLGESSFLTGRPLAERVTALESSRICALRRADFARLVHQHPSIGMRMLQTLGERLDEPEQRPSAMDVTV